MEHEIFNHFFDILQPRGINASGSLVHFGDTVYGQAYPYFSYLFSYDFSHLLGYLLGVASKQLRLLHGESWTPPLW